MNYEGKKEDDTNNIAHFFKELLIDTLQDILSDIDTTNELFITKFDLFQNIRSTNTINTLVNNTFKYQIKSAVITVPLVNLIPYCLTTLTNLCYKDCKFKELLINLGIVTRSTGSIRHLKALHNVFSVKLNKTIPKLSNCIFRIRSTSAIGIVNLNTSFGMIVFDIV